MSQRVKAAAAASLLVFSAVVYLSHSSARVFPFIPTGLVLISIIILAFLFGQDQFYPALGLTVLVGVMSLCLIMAFPVGVIGNDSQKLAMWVQGVAETGSIDVIPSPFYHAAPFFTLLPAIASLVTGLGTRWAMIIYPILTGLIIPLFVAAVSRAVFDDDDIALVAALLSVAAGQTMKFAFEPIPQTLSYYFFIGVIFGLVKATVGKADNRFLALILSFAFVTMYTHKLTLYVITALFGMFFLFIYSNDQFSKGVKMSSELLSSMVLGMGAALALMLYIQWGYITGFLDRAFGWALVIDLQPTTVPPGVYTHATPLTGDFFSILSYAIHILSFLAVAGISWLWLAIYQRNRKGVVLLLSAGCVLAIASIGGIFAPFANGRLHYYAEPILAILIAGGVVQAVRHLDMGRLIGNKSMVVIAIAVLISLQVFVAPATPDFTGTKHGYITESEAEAKSFGQTHLEYGVTDDFYASATTLNSIQKGSKPDVYQPYNKSVLYGRFSPNGHCISYRSGQGNIYSDGNGVYLLQWDLERRLDTEFNRIYSIGETTIHC